MSWAGRRRFLIVSIGAVFIVFIVALILVPTLYRTPSCKDAVQNQGEQGIDCGGPCANLCTALEEAPVVRFTQVVHPTPSRADIIAYVDNPNPGAAARRAPYAVTLYAADHTVLARGSGRIDLPPLSTVPVFIPNFASGNVSGATAFLTIDPAQVSWYALASALPLPQVGSPVLAGTASAPRVTAALTNTGATALGPLTVVATVADSAGNIIAASQTVIPRIAGQGSATATFTWNAPFSSPPAKIEVIPLATLP